MSVDALMGRSTNRKRKNILILMLSALGALMLAWLTEHPPKAPVFGVTEEWVSLPAFTETCAAADGLIFCAGNRQAGAADETGQTLWQMRTDWEHPVIRVFGDTALIYAPGGTAVLLATRSGGQLLDLPHGVDTAAPGPGETLAVVTSGSGYLTETKRLSSTGSVLSTRGYQDRAEVILLFLQDGTLVSGAICTDGAWLLRGEGENILWEETLSDGPILDMRSWRQGFVLWTPGSIRFFHGDGTLVAETPLDCDRLLAWDCDGSLAAVLAESGGKRFLILADTSGAVRQTDPIPGDPYCLTVSSGRACVLDREAMLVYDEAGRLRERISDGAAASRADAFGGTILLTGNGQMLRHRLMN